MGVLDGKLEEKYADVTILHNIMRLTAEVVYASCKCVRACPCEQVTGSCFRSSTSNLDCHNTNEHGRGSIYSSISPMQQIKLIIKKINRNPELFFLPCNHHLHQDVSVL